MFKSRCSNGICEAKPLLSPASSVVVGSDDRSDIKSVGATDSVDGIEKATISSSPWPDAVAVSVGDNMRPTKEDYDNTKCSAHCCWEEFK